MSNAKEPTKCPECEAYKGSHHILCPLQPIEQKVDAGLYYYNLWLTNQDSLQAFMKRFKDKISSLEGRIAILKQENNKLRKALYKSQKL